MFGDIALNQSSSRTATIVCDSLSYLLILTQESYNEALKAIIQKEKTEKMMTVMSSIPQLENFIDLMSFEKVVYSVKVTSNHRQETSFNFGDKILIEGMPSDKIYIVKDGECLVKHKIDQKLFEKIKDHRLQPSKSSRYQGDIDAFAEAILKEKGFLRSTDLAIAYTGDLLGLEACLPTGSGSLFSCFANSQPTIMYSISKQELFKHFKMVIPAATVYFEKKNKKRLENTLKKLEKLLQLGILELC